jgi:heptosyltransferase-1
MLRILLVKTSSLGDVVHNLPAVADILASRPQARIDWVVEEAFADIPRLCPGVARVIPVALRRWRRALARPAVWGEIGRFRAALRAEDYDCVLDTQGLLKSAVLARLARGPRCGQDRASAREPLAALFYQRRFHVARGRHAVVRNRDLAAQALGYPLPGTPPGYGLAPPPADPALALPPAYVVCLHGSSRDSKLWPEPHWVRLATGLLGRGLTPLLPWGSESERARAGRIAAEAPGARVLPRLGVRALASVLAGARGAVGVDSGLTHLAVALERPTVAIYTDTSPLLTGVYPTDPARAVNLGERGVLPSFDEVWAALRGVGVP